MSQRWRKSINPILLLYYIKNFLSDRAIRMTVANTLLSALAMPVTVFLVGRYITPTEQGLFYTFASVLALQILFEMGFAQCLLQFISHEFAGLSISDGKLVAKGAASGGLGRIAAISQISRRWYAFVAIATLVLIGSAGHIFFSHHATADDHWVFAWWLLCLSTAGFLLLQPKMILLEGCHEVAEVSRLRMIYTLTRFVFLCVLLPFGIGLLSTGIASLAGTAVVALILRWKWSVFFKNIPASVGSTINTWKIWSDEIWPLQWKISLSWISGFFIFNSFNPIILHYSGAVEAGRFGMAWALIQGVSNIATSCGAVRVVKYGTFIAQSQWTELNKLWRTATFQSIGISILGVCVLLGGVLVLPHYSGYYASRIVGPSVILLLGIGAVSNQLVFSQAFYLRAFKEDPFLGLSLIFAFGVLGGLFLFTPSYGAQGAALAYCLVTVLVALPLGSFIFLRKRRKAERLQASVGVAANVAVDSHE